MRERNAFDIQTMSREDLDRFYPHCFLFPPIWWEPMQPKYYLKKHLLLDNQVLEVAPIGVNSYFKIGGKGIFQG